MNAGVIARLLNSSADSSGMLHGLGIHNVDERLRHAFGEAYGLSIASEEGKYSSMTIKLPLEIQGHG
jgi:two-component system sensor histidine kinase YesM